MKNACHDLGVARVPISRVNGAGTIAMTDAISVEEPLEICVTTESDEGYFPSTVAVTMRTPGHDDELAAGFLFSEGILSDPSDVESVRNEGRNIVRLKTRRDAMLELAFMNRQSSPQVAARAENARSRPSALPAPIASSRIGPPSRARRSTHCRTSRARREPTSRLPEAFTPRRFSIPWEISSACERMWAATTPSTSSSAPQLLAGQLPLSDRILVLSGRVSFELVQKAAIAGIPVIVAVGTFNYQAGDVGFVPRTIGHYIENIGSTPVRLINIFKTLKYKDISLNPVDGADTTALGRGHLDLDDTAMAALRRDRGPVVR